jgi:hypothetical protein
MSPYLRRFFSPFALVALVLGTTPVHARGELPPLPPAPRAPSPQRAPQHARTFDASLPRPFMMTLQGATASEAWVTMEARDPTGLDQGIVDLATGCIVETPPRFTSAAKLGSVLGSVSAFAVGRSADVTPQAEALMSDPATKADLARFVAMGLRYGRMRLGFGPYADDDVAFSSDGRTILVESGEAVFRSRDGGRTYDRLDANMSRYPAVTADGRWVLYERCSDAARRNQSCPSGSREVRVVSTDDSAPPRTLPIGRGLLRGMDPTGQKLVVVRDDMGSEVTVMHVDPATATMSRAFGVPSTPVKKNRFHDIDPSGAGTFGLFDDNDTVPMSALTVVSMTDGHVIQKLTVRNEMRTVTDDESGRLLWQTFYDDHSWARRPKGAVRDLGMGDPLGWAPGGRALVFATTYAGGRRIPEPPATLGQVACKVVRVTTVQ